MGLDISITRRKKVVCPKCGEVVSYTDVDCKDSGGRVWYSLLKSFGYYVPIEQRTEENDWYAKDMTLTDSQADELYRFLESESVYNGRNVANLIAIARYERDDIVINANW